MAIPGTSLSSSLLLSLALLSAGCARPPTNAVDAAKAALEAARDADAAEYAPESLEAAEDALGNLEAEIVTQSEKFVLFRSFSRVEQLAAATQAAADKAARDVAAGKEGARVAATEIMGGVRASLEEVEDLLARSSGKGTRVEINTTKADVAVVKSVFDDFEAAMAAGEYRDARARAEAARETLDRVKTRLQGAIERQKARPPLDW